MPRPECSSRSWNPPSPGRPAASARQALRRWALAFAGVFFVGLGALGAILPGLPTTIFLILASYCFTRSCPWLEQRLLRTRLFAPYMAWIDGRQPMSRRAKAIAIAMVWAAVATSLALLYSGGRLEPWLAVLVAAAAVVGTVAIASDLALRLLRQPDSTSPPLTNSDLA